MARREKGKNITPILDATESSNNKLDVTFRATNL